MRATDGLQQLDQQLFVRVYEPNDPPKAYPVEPLTASQVPVV